MLITKFLRNAVFMLAAVGLWSCSEDDSNSSSFPEVEVTMNGQKVEDAVFAYSIPEMAIGQTNIMKFTIQNRGEGYLNLGYIGCDNKYFTVAQPAQNLLPPNGKTTFSVTFLAKKGGQHVTNIEFLTNDPDENSFGFLLIGNVPDQAKIDNFVGAVTPKGLNNFDMGDGQLAGSLFDITLAYQDPLKKIDANAQLIINITFPDGTKTSITKTTLDINSTPLSFIDGKALFGIGLRFQQQNNTHADCEAFIRLSDGTETNKVQFRIERPSGAN